MQQIDSPKKLKSRWHWEGDAPRCGTCVHYRAPYIKLRDSLPYRVQSHCDAGKFTTNKYGLCDHWETKDGQKLLSKEGRA